MSYSAMGVTTPLELSPPWPSYYTQPRSALGQWELVGSAAAAAGASYGTMLWGESEVSEFFGTVYGQVLTTALNVVGSIWGIPLGSIVQALAEMFGGLFGGGLSHAEREKLEMARVTGHVKTAAGQIQAEKTLTAVYNRLVFWNTTYVGGSCGGVEQCIGFAVRPLLYALPDVQAVDELHGVGRNIPGGARTFRNRTGYTGLQIDERGTLLDLRTLPVDKWPWVTAGYTGKPSSWYPTTSETGFMRALIAEPEKRFRVSVQAGIRQDWLDPLNKQMADVIRGAIAKIIQRDYGPAIAQAIRLAELTASGTIPTPQQVAAAMAQPGGIPETTAVLMERGVVESRITPGQLPTTQQLATAMAPAIAASPGAGSWMPVLAAAAGLYLATQGG